MSIVLEIKGLGHVPSFKNNKLLLRKQGRLITDPKKQKWMDRCIRSFESQLRYGGQTTAGATWTDRFPPSSTAWFRQFDDSRQWMPEIVVRWRTVAKGREGAIITLEQIA